MDTMDLYSKEGLRSRQTVVRASSFLVGQIGRGGGGVQQARNVALDTMGGSSADSETEHSDFHNYALLIVLYTLQGIPMGLSASIPFLIQQKIKLLSSAAAQTVGVQEDIVAGAASASAVAAHAAKLSYNANAIFALCSWPFSLKLLWAPIVDSLYFKRFGRRKSWLVPVQVLSGILMVLGADFVQEQLGMGALETAPANGGRARKLFKAVRQVEEAASSIQSEDSMNIRGVTAFFFVLYFLMATQDIALDAWALTMLSKKNRGRGPVCNSIGQNIGYFLSFVGFLALNDPEASENLWRPLFGLKSDPEAGLVSLKGFISFMGYFMLTTTVIVAIFKRELPTKQEPDDGLSTSKVALLNSNKIDDDDDEELDASKIGLKETYHRLWAVCQLPAVQWLFVVLLTYRLPTALSDNVKFLKAVEYGLSKSATALLSPTVILPLGIMVPIFATKIWHGHPLSQFMTAYRFRVTLVPLLDLLMLAVIQKGRSHTASGNLVFWSSVIASTAMQAITSSLQFNAQMTFFAHRVDPAIGGSYMTLLNTAANLGGTWPSSCIMWLVSKFTKEATCPPGATTVEEGCSSGSDPYIFLQIVSSILGVVWLICFTTRVRHLADLPADAWRTHLLDSDEVSDEKDLESPGAKPMITVRRTFSKLGKGE